MRDKQHILVLGQSALGNKPECRRTDFVLNS